MKYDEIWKNIYFQFGRFSIKQNYERIMPIYFMYFKNGANEGVFTQLLDLLEIATKYILNHILPSSKSNTTFDTIVLDTEKKM